MTEFLFVCLLLSLLAVAFALLPLRVGVKRPAAPTQQDENVDAFKIRLQELEQEAEFAHYSEVEKEQLRQELQLRLLEEADSQSEQSKPATALWPVVVLVALLLPLASWGLYQSIGAQADFQLLDEQHKFDKAQSAAEIKQLGTSLLATLTQRLQDDSEQPALWMMLGRAQTRLQDYTSAEHSFQSLMQIVGEDPVVMGLYVQSRFMAQGRQLDEVAESLAQRTLELQPNNGTVLGLLGMASFEQQDYQAAIGYWQQLLVMLDPQSPTAQMIRQGVERAQSMVADVPAASITVSVSMANNLVPVADATVFIYARAVNGSKMPLAVVRRPVSDLPFTVELTDAMAMSPAMNLSSFPEVELVARVSTAGIANAASGDLQGVVGPVANSSADTVKLVIDTVL